MSGVAGAVLLPSSHSQETVYDRLKHMLPKLALRGQAGFGLAAFMHEKRVQYTKSSRPPREFTTIDYHEQDADFRPRAAIAHIRSPSSREHDESDVQPVHNDQAGRRHLAISLDGALLNADELRKELLGQGYSFDGETDAELLLKLIERTCQNDYWCHALPVNHERLFREIDNCIDGAVSALLLDGEGNLIAFRNRYGLRPLEFMQTNDGFLLFASENCAFSGLQGNAEEILPGHIKYVNGRTGEWLDRSVCDARYNARLCAYETLYLGNPETSRRQTYLETRYNIGAALGKLIARRLTAEMGSAPIIISSMPRTGGPYADGLFASLAEEGAVIRRQEVIATQCSQRTLLGVVDERISLISQKYRVAEKDVAGSTIIMVDEALIRGDTSRAVTNMLLSAGAKAVHWAIGSPPIVAPNYYGMGIDTIDELAFWQIWKTLAPEQRKQSLRFHNIEPQMLRLIESTIAVSINAAAITYLPFQVLVSFLPQGHDGNDLSPFTFEMPTPAGQKRANRNLNKLIADLPSQNQPSPEVT
ncbi:class II glutamine amidotransferase [Bradyrhizobium sp. CB3481]|uniref:class II glutamine amidotransferase n=1 Tax=Bradyrhizobium sp. CB3481 TaxID=3039158 RepID=UPI0024B1DD9D|nr:class II glutamine amidotransferase [Bradyrhizobium sp. CB3481]WFU14691.1 class II glutamine amidotransferase [Bradyrhizobium sp. CB3481]